MDFLNKSFVQLKDLFQSMTPGTRVTTGLLLVGVIVSLGYLFLQHKAGSNRYLFDEPVTPGELHQMEQALGEAGLEFDIEGARIIAPAGQRHRYLAALGERNALPYNFGTHLSDALEVRGLIRSGQEREVAIKHAKEKELSSIISKMTGVEWAAVMYDSKTKPGLRRQDITTASVTVKPLGSQRLEFDLASGVQSLVAASIAGLDEKDVTVIDLNSGVVFSSDPDNPTNIDRDDRYIARQKYHEERFEARIQELLAHITGLRVLATVTLDNEWHTREDRIQHDPKSVPIKTIDSESKRTVEHENAGGRVGAEAQAMTPRSLAATRSSGPNEEESDTETQTINAISSTRTAKEVWGLTPRRVTVALYVPSSHFERIWHRQNPPDPDAPPDAKPTQPDTAALAQIRDQEMADIEEQVAMILPDVEGVQAKTDLVSAAVYQDIKPEQPLQPGMVSHATNWLGQHWSTLALIGLVVGSLLMLRGMLRATGNVETAARIPPAPMAATDGEGSGADESPAERRLRRFEGGGMSLQEELSDLVNEDPDAAVNILRTWIGSAS